MKYIVAVSGGVDSMVLLDMMAKSVPDEQLVVAHFDHGIREDSADDAAFVAQTAQRYGLPFELKREELGTGASEAYARERRYAFLLQLAEKYNAILVTAHHLDDLVETVAINITRGTGWRGLTPFSGKVMRPLVASEKGALIAYARKNNISWRDDSTNATDAYLRNRLRRKIIRMTSSQKRELLALHARQKELRQEIEHETRQLVGNGPLYERHFFIQAPQAVALECLYAITKGALTRPQLKRVLHAIKVAKPGTVFQAGNGIHFHFTTRQFSL